jgi:uncharacterized protein YraI
MVRVQASKATAIMQWSDCLPGSERKEDTMKRCLHWGVALLAVAVVLPALAQQAAHVRDAADLRAGPARDYRRLDQVMPGDALAVYGCIESRTWCDVRSAQTRGWMPGSAIGLDRHARSSAGNTRKLDVPTIAFSLDAYWDAHYRGRAWTEESERAYWRKYRPGMPPNVAPPVRADTASLSSTSPSRARSSAAPQWTPPGERMYQGPAPDAIKRDIEKNNRSNDVSIDREQTKSNWWPPRPGQGGGR